MKYDIRAIPQTYNGVNFRSHLEASWAVFFHLLKWDWEYEPVDQDSISEIWKEARNSTQWKKG